ncbi:MAG: hypothetical protein JJE25_10895, partial [Bacteroidia bacterium]|nr:hypothetical protein [Bacteroidia bacterium]
MKKSLPILIISMMTASWTLAQVPQAINYQAVARDVSGAIIPNQNIGLRLS